MSGLIRFHHLAPDGALNRRQLRELFYQAAQHLSEVQHESLGDDILSHGHFQDSAFEDFYSNHYSDSNFEVPPGNTLPPGSFDTIDTLDNNVEATLAWSLWAEARSVSCKFVCVWPVVGKEAMWGLACVRQPGPVSVYNTGAVLPGPAYTDKIAWGGGWGVGDDVAMGGEGNVILPRGTRLQTGLLIMTIGGPFKFQKAAVQLTRRAA